MKILKRGLLIAFSFASLAKASHNTFDYSDIAGNFPNDYEWDWETPSGSHKYWSATPYHPDLNCGECVAGGHNFCWRARVPGEMLNDKEYPTMTPYFKSNQLNTDTQQRCCYNDKDVAEEHRNLYCENIVWNRPGADTST